MSSSAIPPAPPPSPVQTAAAVNAVLTAVAGGDGAQALAKLPLGSLVSASVQSLEGKTLVQLVTGTGATLDMKLPLNLTLPPDAELSLQVILQNGLPALKLLSVNGRPLGAGAFPPAGLQGGGAMLLPGAADLLAPAGSPQAGPLGAQPMPGRGDAVALGAAAPGAAPVPTGPLGLTATVVRPAAAGAVMIPQGLGPDGQPQQPQTPPAGFADLAPGTQLTVRIAGIAPPGGAAVPPLPGQPAAAQPGQPQSPPPGAPPQSSSSQPVTPAPGQAATAMPGGASAPVTAAPQAPLPVPGQPVPAGGALPPAGTGLPPLPPSNGAPLTLPGNVIAHSPGGTSLVQTPAGLISLPGGPPMQVGGSVQLEVVGPPVPPPPPPSTNTQNSQGLGPNGWPTLSSAADVLAQADRQAAEQLIRMIPQANPRLAAAMAAFTGAVRSGDFKVLGSDGVIKGLDKAGRRDLADRLKHDFLELTDEAQRPRGNGDWQVVTLPFAHGADIDPIQLYVHRHKDEEEGKGGKGQEQRFILEIHMSNLGRMQFDGLIHRDSKRFDLIIRTSEPLGAEICRDIGGIFAECGQLTGTKGTVGFQSGRPFVELPPCDAKGTRIMV